MTKATVRKHTALKNRKRRLRKCIMLITFALMACVILGTVLTVKSQSAETIRISDEAYKEFVKYAAAYAEPF